MSTEDVSGRTKAAQREATVAALLSHAREAFAVEGYRAASLEEIARAAGVTKGALYHHFRGGKRELFRAVAAEVHANVAARVASAASDADLWQQLLAGCRAFLEATLEPAAQQILLLDAPAVLGWADWRGMDAASSMQHLDEALERLMVAGVIDDVPRRPLVHLLSGAMNEAALAMAQAADPQRELEQTTVVLERLLEALRLPANPR